MKWIGDDGVTVSLGAKSLTSTIDDRGHVRTLVECLGLDAIETMRRSRSGRLVATLGRLYETADTKTVDLGRYRLNEDEQPRYSLGFRRLASILVWLDALDESVPSLAADAPDASPAPTPPTAESRSRQDEVRATTEPDPWSDADAHYRDSWRASYPGARTDWGFLSPAMRAEWRRKIDFAAAMSALA